MVPFVQITNILLVTQLNFTLSFGLCKICQCSLFYLLTFLLYFERTRTPFTSFLHSSLSAMIFFRSSILKPMSFLSWSTYVVAGLPLFRLPCFGSHRITLLLNSSFLLQLCPMKRSLLTHSDFVTFSSSP